MPQPMQPTPIPTAPSSPFFVAVPFVHPHHVHQEPKSAPDTPSGTGPAGPGPAPDGTQQVPDPRQGPPATQPCALDSTMMLYGGGFLLLMYFMILRPENKRRKQQQELLSSVKVGDRVVTLGGMHGTVASLADKTVTLRVDTVKITIDRTAIGRVERGDAPAANAPSS